MECGRCDKKYSFCHKFDHEDKPVCVKAKPVRNIGLL